MIMLSIINACPNGQLASCKFADKGAGHRGKALRVKRGSLKATTGGLRKPFLPPVVVLNILLAGHFRVQKL